MSGPASKITRITLSCVLTLGLMPSVAFGDEVPQNNAPPTPDAAATPYTLSVEESLLQEDISLSPSPATSDSTDPNNNTTPPETSGFEEETLVPASENPAITTPSVPTPLELDTAHNLAIEAGNAVVFVFAAPNKGSFIFESKGDSDTYGHLYSDSALENEIASDDDSGDNTNFSLSITLEAGQSVYLKVRPLNSTGSAACTVQVKAEDPYDLTSLALTSNTDGWLVDGSFHAPKLTLTTRDGINLTEGTHYRIAGYQRNGVPLQGSPTELGYHDAIVEGIAPYHGATTVPFEAKQRSSITPLSYNSIDSVNLENWQDTFFSFTAPHNGAFSFACLSFGQNSLGSSMTLYSDQAMTAVLDSQDGGHWMSYASASGTFAELVEGQTVYLKIVAPAGTFNISASDGKNIENCNVFAENGNEGTIFPDSFSPPVLRAYCYDTQAKDWKDVTLTSDYLITGYEDFEGNPLVGNPKSAGTFYAVIEGVNSYHGRTKVAFTTRDGYDLSTMNAFQSGNAYVRNGTVYNLSFNVQYYHQATESWRNLALNTDFRIKGYQTNDGIDLAGAPTTAGHYKAILEGIGTYRGETTCYFSLSDASDLSRANIYASNASYDQQGRWNFVSTGAPLVPLLNVTDLAGSTLTQGTHFDISYKTKTGEALAEAPSDQGEYTLVITAIQQSGYTGGIERSFNIISAYDLAGYNGHVPQNPVYSGKPIAEPTISLYRNNPNSSETLMQNVDFKVKGYIGNDGPSAEPTTTPPTEIGSYHVVVEGVGKYFGEKIIYFSIIDPFNLQAASVTSSGSNRYQYTGSPVELNMIIKGANGTALQSGTDYVTEFRKGYNGEALSGAPSEPGQYSVRFVAATGSAYKGATSSFSFSIYDPTNLNSFSISLRGGISISNQGGNETFYFYTGQALKPEVGLYLSGGGSGSSGNTNSLKEGVDYLLSYDNNIGSPDKHETATITATGIGAYKGSTSESFVITPSLDLSLLKSTYPSLRYGNTSYFSPSSTPTFLNNGCAIRPTIQFKSSSPYPIEGIDYRLSYTDTAGTVVEPRADGNYQVVATALEGSRFTGELQLSYAIASQLSIAGDTLQLNKVSITEQVQGVWIIPVGETPSWSIRGNTLVEGYDYTLSTAYDEARDIYTVTAQGIGNYRDTISTRFKYDSNALSGNRSWYVNNAYASSGSGASTPVVFIDAEGSLITPEVTNNRYAENLDYRIAGLRDQEGQSISSPISGTDYYLKVEGMGAYAGSELNFLVTVKQQEASKDKDLSSRGSTLLYRSYKSNSIGKDWVCLDTSEGPQAQVTYLENRKRTQLVQGKDYTQTFTRNEDGKTATLSIEAIGGSDYIGSIVNTIRLVDAFDIGEFSQLWLKEDLSSGRQNYSKLSYFGTPYRPEIVLASNLSPSTDGAGNTGRLQDGIDFTSELLDENGSPVNLISHTGTYTIVAKGTGDFTGTISKEIVVEEASAEIPLSFCVASLDTKNGYALLQNGKAEPQATLTYQGAALTEGIDYRLEYRNNTALGKAYILATGMEGGRFKGSLVQSFSVVEAYDISTIGSLVNITANGYFFVSSSSRTSATISEGAATLNLGVRLPSPPSSPREEYLDPSCYDIEYGDNTSPGVAWVKVTGKNGYVGTLTANFYAVAKPIADGWNTIEGKTYYYTKGSPAKGERLIDGAWYHFDESTGAMSTGLTTMPDGRTLYFNDSGVMTKGEVLMEGGWRYFDWNSGNMAVGITVHPDGRTLYYDESGFMQKGEQLLADGWHYFDWGTGNMAVGLTKMPEQDGRTLYFNDSGVMTKGEV
ncbi:MAG: hypothetical protein RR178_00020, partial [Gordonibacter sp.]